MKLDILNAVAAKASADEAKAIANLKVYLTNPAGIGEHPDVVGEVTKLLKDMQEARDLFEITNEIAQAVTPQTPEEDDTEE